MNITLSLEELFIVIGGAIALMLSIAFIIRSKKNRMVTVWLVIFCLANVFVIFIRILNSTGYIFDFPQFLRFNYPIGLTRSALFFLFIQYLYKGYKKIKWFHLLHFLPAIAVMLYFLPFYFSSSAEKISWLQGIELITNSNLPGWYIYFINIYSIIYFAAALKIFISSKNLTRKAVNLFISIMFVTIAVFLFFANLSLFLGNNSGIIDIMYLVISGGFLIISVFMLASPVGIKIIQDSKYKSSNLDEKLGKKILEKARKALEQEKLYQDPELKLTDLAEKISVPSYLLSNALNQQTGKTFNDFINNFRVNEAIEILSDDKNSHLTIEAVGYEVGFNSRTSFYAAFKKIKNITPAAFRKSPEI